MSTEGLGSEVPAGATSTRPAPPNRWADPRYLKDVQYATPGNLGARQAIYAYQRPVIRFYDWALDLAELEGGEKILDIGCGNGGYLGTLHRHGHEGLTVGMDFSAGMLSTARLMADPDHMQSVVQGDAAALPFAGGTADVVLVMHMLYHVPDPTMALAEVRRILRPGGRVLIVLNGSGHQHELRDLLREALVCAGESPVDISASEAFDLDAGEELAARFFSVARHDIRSDLVVPEPEPVLGYVRSMGFLQSRQAKQRQMLRFIEDRVSDVIAAEGAFRMSTASGCLVCRCR